METRLDKTLLSGGLFLIGLLVTAVNLLTIMVVLRTPQLRHSDQWQANMYVLSLAVADTLVGAALVWMACLFIPETRAFIDSSYALCTSGVIVGSVFVSVSHATLLVIALDRLCYIVYPFFYGRFVSNRLTMALIFSIWCLSTASISTIRVFSKQNMTGNCKPFSGRNKYETLFANVFLLLEVLLSGACYLRIACVVRNQQRRIRTILQVTANFSSKDNDLLYRDNRTTSKQKIVAPKASGGDPMSVKKVQENGHLEPQTVLSVQDEGSYGITLQTGPSCQSSSDTGPSCQSSSDTGPNCLTSSDTGPNCQTSSDTGPSCQSSSDTGPSCQTSSDTGPSCQSSSDTGPSCQTSSDTGPSCQTSSDTGPNCQTSSDPGQWHDDHNGVGQSTVASLATCKTEKRTGSPSDTMKCLQLHSPKTGPVHHGFQVQSVCKPWVHQKDLKKSQSVGMFVALNILFSISWIPFVVYSNFFDRGLDNDEGAIAALMPVFINSLLNFVVYTWKNIEYRKAYKKLFITFIYCVFIRRT